MLGALGFFLLMGGQAHAGKDAELWKAENFTALDRAGQPVTVDFAKYQGRVVLLHFWGAWGDAVPEMASLQKFAATHPEVTVISVHWTNREPTEPVRQAVAKTVGANPANLIFLFDDKDGKVALEQYKVPIFADRQGAVAYFSGTFFMDTKGRIAMERIGLFEWSNPRLEGILKELRGEKPALAAPKKK